MVVIAGIGLVSGTPATAAELSAGGSHQASGAAASAAEYAKSQIGKPYRYGGTGPDAFDCSGLTQWAYDKAGVKIGRTTYDQVTEGTAVSHGDLLPGDLVFFYSGPSHVGMYVGDGKMVHAPSSGKSIHVVTMSDYYDRHFHSARRIA
ncbi:cell wall-associated NlpC family hydrolase [Spinactinospora alkalitolerans]|uniref:Cell wall-associated NlpC family hydrolase n=1 Tax=Spinactinospora alkalitolerans TaxID=687207 RepID=A0A852TP15_9ACTN|nr:C40 family peptidase [Spinactinospora alkalitolerans]NYE45037.1 cell wall-associated NlpC family hydrolase [Spinactinospora alkalitolerans]